MGLVEQRAGVAERAVGGESGNDQEDDHDTQNQGCPYQDGTPPQAADMTADPTSVGVLRVLAVLPPVAHSVAVRVGAVLAAMSIRGHLAARVDHYSLGASPVSGARVGAPGVDFPSLA